MAEEFQTHFQFRNALVFANRLTNSVCSLPEMRNLVNRTKTRKETELFSCRNSLEVKS